MIIILLLILIVIYYLFFNNIKEHLDDPSITNNISSLAAIYNSGGPVNTSELTINQITGIGRLHISSPNELYVLNKLGLVVGKEWGGNGSITAQGSISAGDNVTTPFVNLGNKFKLSGAGDGYGNDEWLRLVKPDSNQYSGTGFAASKMWTDNLHAGTLDSGNTVVNGTLRVTGDIVTSHYRIYSNPQPTGNRVVYYLNGDGKEPYVAIRTNGTAFMMGTYGGKVWDAWHGEPCRNDRAQLDGGCWAHKTCGSDCGC